MIRALTIIGLWLICLGGYSQAPGYQGKRFIASFSTGYSPVIKKRFGRNLQRHIAVNHNLSYEGFAEYVLTRKSSVVGGYKSATTFYHLSRYETSAIFNGTSYSAFESPQTGTDELSLSEIGDILITSQSFYIGTKRYISQAIAPLGPYLQAHLEVSNHRAVYSDNDLRTPQNTQPRINDFLANEPEDITFSTLALNFTYGRQRVFANRFIFGWAVEMSVSLSNPVFSSSGEEEHSTVSIITGTDTSVQSNREAILVDQLIEESAERRWISRNFLQGKLTLGLMGP